jgi:hypothetical protein
LRVKRLRRRFSGESPRGASNACPNTFADIVSNFRPTRATFSSTRSRTTSVAVPSLRRSPICGSPSKRSANS